VGSMLHTLKQRRLFHEVLSPDIRIIKFSRWTFMGLLSSTFNVNEKLKKKKLFLSNEELMCYIIKISNSKD
jgi:hypothetical protein